MLPLFQMIAKNVGIRRARGEFILATNIDILFSNELMALVAQKAFRADRLYRCDRFDVDSTIPKDVPLDEKLRFAWANLIRRNHRLAPLDVIAPQIEGAPPDVAINTGLASGHFELETERTLSALVAKADVPPLWLHLNACGDFTLMHRDGWAKIGGYAEFETFSLHLDSLGVVTAHLSGFREAWLPPPAVCFHIEHALGSGLTPENQAPMFERIERQGIGWLDFNVIEPFLDEMREKRLIEFNTDAWGLRDIPLDETVCTRERIEVRKVPEALQADRYAPVTAIRPEINADRPFRVALKRLEARIHALRDEWEQEALKPLEARIHVLDDECTQCYGWVHMTKRRAEAAEAWAKGAEARAQAAEAQLERLRVENEQKRRLLDKYRRFFGWFEKLPSLK
jgi:hypothetical protein